MEIMCFASLLSFLLCYISSLIFAFPLLKMALAGYDYAVSGAICSFPFLENR